MEIPRKEISLSFRKVCSLCTNFPASLFRAAESFVYPTHDVKILNKPELHFEKIPERRAGPMLENVRPIKLEWDEDI